MLFKKSQIFWLLEHQTCMRVSRTRQFKAGAVMCLKAIRPVCSSMATNPFIYQVIVTYRDMQQKSEKRKTQYMRGNGNWEMKPRPVNNLILNIKIKKMVKSWQTAVKKSKHRFRVLKQWYETQNAYIGDLVLIKDEIQKPLLQAELISQDEDKILFPNIDSMLSLSRLLLKNIQGFIYNWHPRNTMIGQVLMDIYKGFIIYRDYCNNFYKGQEIISKIKDRHKKEFQQLERNLDMDVESYMIKPVQRPPKYQLLLREYEKVISQDHPDAKSLKQAIEKYREVNDENNKSMDEQIRQAKLTELQKKFGGIMKRARVFLFEQVAKSIDYKVKLYVFNDLIFVVRIINEEKKEEQYRKIFLNGRSFVDAPMDGKYFINKLFICGQNENIHLNFFGASSKERVYSAVNQLIQDLYNKETSRNSIKKRSKAKMQVTNIETMRVKSEPKLRITVVGVQKRLLSSIKYEVFYILKIQVPFPDNIFQYSYLKFEELVELETEIKAKNKMLSLPLLNDHPEGMGYYDIQKNKTRIIQYRQIYIQRYLNYIIRLQEMQEHLETVCQKLKINEQLWEFGIYDEPCGCNRCTSPQLHASFKDYESEKSSLKDLKSSPNPYEKQLSYRSSVSYSEQDSRRISYMPDDGYCVYNSLLKSIKLADAPIEELNSLSRRLAWVDAQMGRIEYVFLRTNEQFKNIKVPIYFFSLKENEKTYVWINHYTTVYEVIQEIAEAYHLDSLRDFGLFVVCMNYPRLIDRDEKLWEIILNYQLEYNEKQEEASQQNPSFLKRLSSFKKWGEEMIGAQKSKIYLRKYLFVEDDLEIEACQSNPQRYSLIIEEVFYRFKYEILILNQNATKKLCALYYIIRNIDRIPLLSSGTFQIEKLKALLPESKWNKCMQMEDFEKDIFMSIKSYWLRVQECPQQSSKIFEKVQIIYNCIITLVHNLIGWKTLFFDVKNHDPATLPGKQEQLLLGINRHELVIMKPKKLAPLVSIPLLKLEYKVTVFSIFVDTSERTLRFNGKMMYDIKKLIQIYRNLAEKFNPTS